MTVIHEPEWYATCPVGTVLVDERDNEYTKTAPDTWDTWAGLIGDAQLNGGRWGALTIQTMPKEA